MPARPSAAVRVFGFFDIEVPFFVLRLLPLVVGGFLRVFLLACRPSEMPKKVTIGSDIAFSGALPCVFTFCVF
jgi:hypothetical protein